MFYSFFLLHVFIALLVVGIAAGNFNLNALHYLSLNIFLDELAFLGYFDLIYALPNVWLAVPFTFIGQSS